MKSIILTFLLVFLQILIYAQTPQKTEKTILQNQSLLQCTEYAISKSMLIANAKLEQQIISAKVGEGRATSLPQINSNFTVIDNFAVQKTFLNTNQFDNKANDNAISAWNLQMPYQSIASINISQTVFNPLALVGAKTAKVYAELAEKNMKQTENEIKYTVSKAYYTVLVNEARLKIATENLRNIEELLNETKTMFANGTIEKLDLNKLEVRFVNLQTELEKLTQLTELAKALLKFQMGLSQEDEINLSENIITISDTIKKYERQGIDNQGINSFNYQKRHEFSVLESQKNLNLLAIQSNKLAYYPTVNLFANGGANIGSLSFGNLFIPNNWYSFFYVGLGINIPIFDGLQKSYIGQQRKLALQKTENLLTETKRLIDFQQKQAKTNFKNASASLANQQRNQDLAAEILSITKIKFKEGIVTNMEVLNAETAYKEAQNNYFSALYDVLLAKIELDSKF
jgi:outer membrane protein TolC